MQFIISETGEVSGSVDYTDGETWEWSRSTYIEGRTYDGCGSNWACQDGHNVYWSELYSSGHYYYSGTFGNDRVEGTYS